MTLPKGEKEFFEHSSLNSHPLPGCFLVLGLPQTMVWAAETERYTFCCTDAKSTLSQDLLEVRPPYLSQVEEPHFEHAPGEQRGGHSLYQG